MDDIVISAPGKVILHGEHAVVYGKRALAASLDLRTFLRLQSTSDGHVVVSLPDIGLKTKWSSKSLQGGLQLPFCDPHHPMAPGYELLQKLKDFAGVSTDSTETKQLAVVAFLYLYCGILCKDGELPSINVCLASKLPTSAGLGSSAAFSTSLSASFLRLSHLIEPPVPHEDGHLGMWAAKDLDLINKWAFQGEKIIHGNPSGIDNSVSSYGGALNFQSGRITPLKRVPTLRVLLFNTRVPRSTKVLVAGVRDRYNKFPDIIGPILDSIEAISSKCEDLFTKLCSENTSEHFSSLQDLIEINHHLLAVLGVSHPALEQICHMTANHGLKSKLTGAGGGGCAFALIPSGFDLEVIAKLSQEMSALGYDCWETTIGGYGVIEHIDLNGHFTLPESFS